MSQGVRCPKCPGTMRVYNRSGIHIDQCDQCRGVFLDYGELEALSQAEQQYHQAAPPPPPPPPPAPGYAAPGPGWGVQQPHYSGHYGGHHKRKGFGHFLFSS
ncbi:zf-TFIIB domain containing protein [Pseudonocardiaceae bacterium YIM PH 21723]|nr:zf-TFIIB domain containing protein [Pseudonocardiaceae bacterium YIM PH 21723]